MEKTLTPTAAKALHDAWRRADAVDRRRLLDSLSESEREDLVIYAANEAARLVFREGEK